MITASLMFKFSKKFRCIDQTFTYISDNVVVLNRNKLYTIIKIVRDKINDSFKTMRHVENECRQILL